MQNIVIGIIVIVLIGIGAWAWTQTNQEPRQQPNTAQQDENTPTESRNTEEEQEEETEATEVTYTDDGFSPDTVTVKEGATVLWTNGSEGQMWIASNVHPTHNELPGFDQKNGVESGGEFSYQFEQTGEWGYHNHLNPSHQGTVVVE